jgi:hypothetical protein
MEPHTGRVNRDPNQKIAINKFLLSAAAQSSDTPHNIGTSGNRPQSTLEHVQTYWNAFHPVNAAVDAVDAVKSDVTRSVVNFQDLGHGAHDIITKLRTEKRFVPTPEGSGGELSSDRTTWDIIRDGFGSGRHMVDTSYRTMDGKTHESQEIRGTEHGHDILPNLVTAGVDATKWLAGAYLTKGIVKTAMSNEEPEEIETTPEQTSDMFINDAVDFVKQNKTIFGGIAALGTLAVIHSVKNYTMTKPGAIRAQ